MVCMLVVWISWLFIVVDLLLVCCLLVVCLLDAIKVCIVGVWVEVCVVCHFGYGFSVRWVVAYFTGDSC